MEPDHFFYVNVAGKPVESAISHMQQFHHEYVGWHEIECIEGGTFYGMQALNADTGELVGYALSAPDANNNTNCI